MKELNHPTQVIVFDNQSLNCIESLQCVVQAVESSISNKQKMLLLCGVFSSTDKSLLSLAQDAPKLSAQTLLNRVTQIISIHFEVIQTLDRTYQINDEQFQFQIKDYITTIFQDIRTLFNGIRFVKEISPRTSQLILHYASRLCAVLIQSIMYYSHNILLPIKADHNDHATLLSLHHAIIPLSFIDHTIDNEIARIAVECSATALNIWTHIDGIMTANPKLVSQAKPIECIDYTTAIEIAYLGGKILHPTAITLLQKHDIPLKIYSMNNASQPASIVSNQSVQNSQSKCITITERDLFTMLSIRSTRMFETYGYLEQIFKFFNTLQIPVETITSSEISITVTFPTQYFSDALINQLSPLGKMEYTHNQSIISIIGNTYWHSPNHIAEALNALSHDIKINMISLGKSGTNLSIVLDTSNTQLAIVQLHARLFED